MVSQMKSGFPNEKSLATICVESIIASHVTYNYWCLLNPHELQFHQLFAMTRGWYAQKSFYVGGIASSDGDVKKKEPSAPQNDYDVVAAVRIAAAEERTDHAAQDPFRTVP